MKSTTKILAVLAAIVTLVACKKEQQYEMYTFYRPVYKTKAAVRAEIKSSPAISIENPGKIYVKDNYVFLNDVDKGIHVIDFSNPANPVNKAFVSIPGCRDIAVKNNFLYADCFTDLVTIDIGNANNVVLKNYINNVFPQRYYYSGMEDTTKMLVEWVRVDTMVKAGMTEDWSNGGVVFNSPGTLASSGGGQGNGTGGSMAAFALLGNRLYTVDHSNLKVFNTSNAASPQFVSDVYLGTWTIETIFPFQDKLFIGSQNGMMIYSVANADAPAFLSSFQHATMCDPVIADGNTAYITLRSGGMCPGTSNQLDVLDIQNISNPTLVRTYPLTGPKGLSKDGNTLLVCDGSGGLKMFDATSRDAIVQKAVLNNIDPYDVIALNGTAIVSASNGIYFVSYTQPNALTLKGKIVIN